MTRDELRARAELREERLTNAKYDRAQERIAELEAQVAELSKGESREWVKSTQLDELQARIAELEAERDSWKNAAMTTSRRDAVLAEREACAKIADELAADNPFDTIGADIAAAIRSRPAP